VGFAEPGPPGAYRAIPGVPAHRSNYLDFLPGIYRESQFLGRFLLIFESILGPIERTVDNISHYFDPALTPPECVAWLGSWLGLVLDERWPEERRRGLISAAVELYQWRGTRRGLSEFVRLYSGITPEIVELSLSEVSAAPNRAFRFTLRLHLPPGVELDRELLESIIDLEKPAFAACALELVPADEPGTPRRPGRPGA
jgi:phage tail-like protein